MLPRVDPTSTSAWSRLTRHLEEIRFLHMRYLLERDPQRFQRFSICSEGDFLVDFSKNRITQETLEILFGLAGECGLEQAIEGMFSGKAINETDKRRMLHVALRNPSCSHHQVRGRDVMPRVREALQKMGAFS